MDSPSELVAQVLTLALGRAPTLGNGRLISIDGPSGSGKTTLAAAIGEVEPTARVIHMDDLYPGWNGLPNVGPQLDTLLRPMIVGKPGTFRRYDWDAGRLAETVEVAPAPLLVVEGVGSGLAACDDLRTLLVWLTAPTPVRRQRGLDRDGAAYAPHWRRWASAESDHFATDRTQARADLSVDTG